MMKLGRYSVFLAVGLFASASISPPPASAQLSDILLAPKTLIDRAIEARSAKDIAIDNRIVVEVNAIMVEYTTLKASTEIYEQRLLLTGIFDDKKLFDEFSAEVRGVEGVFRPVSTTTWSFGSRRWASSSCASRRRSCWTQASAQFKATS